VIFDNYLDPSAPVQWTGDPSLAPPGRAGSLVVLEDGIVANLLWQFGSNSGDAGLRMPVGDPPGFFGGGAVILLPGYSSPAPITFTVQAWAGVDYASATARGSVTWTEVLLSPGQNPVSMRYPLIVQYVPEPSVLALIGMGIGALLIARRRT
jgi:hypothetical protein